MSDTELAPNAEIPPPPPLSPDPPQQPPPMALRTYRMLRLCSVGVIGLLAISIWLEYNRTDPDCLQGSISAYYYTGVQTVFVGTLLALGLVMIVLWGKTPFEDGVLNLAGIVAPVVAFAPTGKPTRCGLLDAAGNEVTTNRQKNAVINASENGIDNNMLAYLIAVGLVLAILLIVGILAFTVKKYQWTTISGHWKSYWIPWALALAALVYGSFKYRTDRDWIYDGAHKAAAITFFIFIVAVVINIGFQKWNGVEGYPDEQSPPWAMGYWVLAAVMAVGAGVVILVGEQTSGAFHDHFVFVVEAWMIFWLAVFWLVQTWDRWDDGAPRFEAAEPAPAGGAPQANGAGQ